MSDKKILLLNGPNLNMLGVREPETYGNENFNDVIEKCTAHATKLGINLTSEQSNHEGEIVDVIQKSLGVFDGIIINAGAYTHTSIAIRDALASVDLPIVEVHISNIYKREEFRQHSLISDIAEGCIVGLGTHGYILAIDYFANAK